MFCKTMRLAPFGNELMPPVWYWADAFSTQRVGEQRLELTGEVPAPGGALEVSCYLFSLLAGIGNRYSIVITKNHEATRVCV